MSAYTMLAEQSPLAASAFSTADAVAPASFDSNDFLGLGFGADEWNMNFNNSLSPSFSSSWNPTKYETAPFATVSFERDLKASSATAPVRNGQPTPPLDDHGHIDYSNSNHNKYFNHDRHNDHTTHYSLHKDLSPPGSFTMANFTTQNTAWDDTPTPPSSDDRAGPNHRDADYPATTLSSPPKRRRLRSSGQHKPSIATTTSTISSGVDSDDQTKELSKREKFLERNRQAASKCRQKKKEHTMQLETRYKEASEKRDMLNAEIARLRREVLQLKDAVLVHAQCDDEPIKLHIEQMVKQIASMSRNDDPAAVANAVANSAAAATALADGAREALPDTERSPSSLRDSVSFGFDDPLHNMDGSATSLEQQIRRDSEASIALSADDDFNDLINV